MATVTLSWLHLTDLHQGLSAQSYLWPQLEHLFYLDLERLHRRAGPFDLLLFTGDLTQRGSAEEFQRLDAALERLYARLRCLGSDPILLAVPGNHDLVRPNPREPATKLLLDRFHGDAELRHEFFTDPACDYRKVVDLAFANYSAWWQGHRFPRPRSLAPGLLPGEYAAIVDKGGLELGVLGLNSAFLQLAAGDVAGRLWLHPLQLHEPCGGNGAAWTDERSACLLLTHHPPSWLSREAQQDLSGEIAPPGRFLAHLYGHMHEAAARTVLTGGGAPVRQWQGCSLFGLEHFGDSALERSHGYTAGRLEVDGGGQARLRLWPRRALRDPQGAFRIAPDYVSFDLEEDHGTRPEPVALRASPDLRRRRPGPPARAEPPPHPREPYRRAWYVPRPKEERIALALLRAPGAPVLLWGAAGVGKSWLLSHLLERVAEEGEELGHVAALDLQELPGEARRGAATLDAFARAFAERLVQTVGGTPEWVERAWRYGTPGTKLSRVLSQHLLQPAGGRVVLAIDRADALFGLPFEDDFFALLRSWADDQEEPWLCLRLLLSVSITPALLTHKKTHSPLLNRVVPIHLGAFSDEQVEELLARHDLGRSRRDMRALMDLVGGNPYLVRLAVHAAHLHGLALRELSDEEVVRRVFADHLAELRATLEARGLLGPLRRLLADPCAALDPAVYEQLHRAGCIEREDDDGYRVPCKLYEDFIRGL